ncbi:hypothetical protein Hanom_Chr04g00305331 [Helianthus anomalus]
MKVTKFEPRQAPAHTLSSSVHTEHLTSQSRVAHMWFDSFKPLLISRSKD